MSNFTTEYHKKYGRQLRLADYDSNLYQNLKELLESIPHILQILDSQYDKKLTLTHRVQVRRFSNDLIKVLKSHPTKQMFADEYPITYEKHFGRKFEIRDYGVCYLEDMLAELPESIICRKEIEGILKILIEVFYKKTGIVF
jgi:meiosis arrest female protein 1